MAVAPHTNVIGDDAATSNDYPWISYSVDSSKLHRHVRLRSGAIATSSVSLRATDGDLARDFDLSWMRATRAPSVSSPAKSIRAADIFAGCGGMSLGLVEGARAAGLACEFEFACEMDAVKAGVYSANLAPSQMHVGEIEQLVDGAVGSTTTLSERSLLNRLKPIDVLLGGPPCQGHSDLNNHTRRDDPRNNLVDRMVRFAELVEPEIVIVENVQGIRHDRRRAATKAAEGLRELGYNVDELLVPCLRLGVPQSRRRYMLVATKKASDAALADFTGLDLSPRSVGWALDDLLDIPQDTVFDSPARHAAANEKRIRYLFEHDLYTLPDAERPDCHRLKKHSYNGVYGRMDWNSPAPTITTGFGSTGQGRFVHPTCPRTVTPHEAARLQTYPDFFSFGDAGRTQLQKMIGNSVPPLAMAALAVALLR